MLTTSTSAHCSGMSGCMANQIPHTQVMCPTFVSTTTMSTRRSTSPTATGFFRTTTTPPQPSHPRNLTYLDTQERAAAAISRSEQNSSVLGSLGNCLWKQLVDYESVDSGKKLPRKLVWTRTEKTLIPLTRSESQGMRSRSERCAFVKRQKISVKSLSGKL